MKKSRFSIVVIALSLILLLTGCDSALDNLFKLTENNIYIQNGIVQVSKVNSEAVKNQVDSYKDSDLKADEESGKIDLSTSQDFKNISDALAGAGITTEIEIKEDLKEVISAAPPLKPENTSTLYDNIQSFNQAEKNEFVSYAQEKADETVAASAKSSYAIASSVIDTVKTSLNSDSEAESNTYVKVLDELSSSLTELAKKEDITKGDVMQAQILTNFVESAAKAAPALKESASTEELLAKEEVKNLVNEANKVIYISNELVGSNLFEKINIESLLKDFMGQSRSVSRTAESKEINYPYEADGKWVLTELSSDTVSTINRYAGLAFTALEESFGIKINSDGTIDASRYDYVVRNNKISSNAMNSIVGLIKGEPTLKDGSYGYSFESGTYKSLFSKYSLQSFIQYCLASLSNELSSINIGNYGIIDILEDALKNSSTSIVANKTFSVGDKIAISDELYQTLVNAGVISTDSGSFNFNIKSLIKLVPEAKVKAIAVNLDKFYIGAGLDFMKNNNFYSIVSDMYSNN